MPSSRHSHFSRVRTAHRLRKRCALRILRILHERAPEEGQQRAERSKRIGK
jgi:hypothetical protein